MWLRSWCARATPKNIALTALVELAREGKYPSDKLEAAIKTLKLNPNKTNPVAM
jgi:hypothetical protein